MVYSTVNDNLLSGSIPSEFSNWGSSVKTFIVSSTNDSPKLWLVNASAGCDLVVVGFTALKMVFDTKDLSDAILRRLFPEDAMNSSFSEIDVGKEQQPSRGRMVLQVHSSHTFEPLTSLTMMDGDNNSSSTTLLQHSLLLHELHAAKSGKPLTRSS